MCNVFYICQKNENVLTVTICIVIRILADPEFTYWKRDVMYADRNSFEKIFYWFDI